MQTVEITISGARVHGVGFRYFVLKKAQQLELLGYVKNTYNGKVKAVVQGDENLIQNFIEFCKKGPNLAHVEKVDFQVVPSLDFTIFEIRY